VLSVVCDGAVVVSSSSSPDVPAITIPPNITRHTTTTIIIIVFSFMEGVVFTLVELLSPVGDFECLKSAVQNGANSVYLGASSFNARARATNFGNEELLEAIKYAKLRNVSVHLTLNTLIKNDEFENAVNLAVNAYNLGVDAIIVQDLGLAKILIDAFPDLPIHGSTQMSVHNLQGVLELQKLGFKRVVLARELSIDEIDYITQNSEI